MRVNHSGLVVAAAFYGLLWYAFEHDVDYRIMPLAMVVLSVVAGWVSVGVIADSPLGPRWLRRRVRKQ